MKKTLYFLVALSLLLGCQKKVRNPDKLQLIRLNCHGEPPSMDTRKAIDTTSISLIGLCFEGLTRHVKNGPPEFAVAESVKISPDNLIYTFYLREAYWWDGKPVTAHDFESTWKKTLSPDFLAPAANDLYVIKGAQEAKSGKISPDEIGVRAIDDKTLEVELKNPVPYFLDLVSSHIYMAVPRHQVLNNPKWADRFDETFVGNGPFKLTKWAHHNQMIFEKNPLYWDKDRVTLNTLEISIIPDETTELNMFEAGELDWAGRPLSTLPTDALYALSKQRRLNTYPISATYFYLFNVRELPFSNLNFRKAFALAINRQEIIDNITQSHQLPATALIPPTMWKLNKGYFEDNDLAAARAHFDLGLKEMGITRDELPPITLTYNTMDSHHKIAQAIQQQWQTAFGIRVGLRNKEWKVFLDEVGHKQFQIARMGGVAGFNDPVAFLDQYRYQNSASNYTGWMNPQYTKLLEEAEQTTDQEKRMELLKEAEKIMMEEMPLIPIYFYTMSFIHQPYIRNVQISDLSEANFKLAHIEW